MTPGTTSPPPSPLRRLRILGVSFALLLAAVPASAQETAMPHSPVSAPSSHAALSSDILGLWYTKDNEAGIELYNCEGLLCGRTHYLPADAGPRDSRNPDPARRDRILCGLTILTGFRPDGLGNYVDGHVYDPESGSTYSAQMHLVSPESLEIHGYVLIPALGASQTWTRTAAMPACTPPITATSLTAPPPAAPKAMP